MGNWRRGSAIGLHPIGPVFDPRIAHHLEECPMNYYTFEPHWPYEKIKAAIAAAKAPKPMVEGAEFCNWVAPMDKEMDVEEQGMIQFGVIMRDEDEIIAKAKKLGT